MAVDKVVKIRDLCLPEFDKNMSTESQKALVFDTPCRYDIILGSVLLGKVGIKINYEDVIEWYDSRLPLRNTNGPNPKDFKEM